MRGLKPLKRRNTGKTGFLGRLARDRRGNTLAMMAALLVPLIGMVGGGVDMARAYMARAKLQTACDSSALAARRVMGASAFNAEAEAEGERFFAFNFPNGMMGTAPVQVDIGEHPSDRSVVQVTASTTVPTTIMSMFGMSSIAINVTCQADKDYVNNDIMLVLDVTASMNCRIGGGTNCTTEESNSRVDRLRSAALELYDELDDAVGVRTRYGFMPYSMTVNVGLDMQENWLLGSSTNQASYRWYNNNAWATRNKTFSLAGMVNPANETNFQTRTGFCLEERSSSDTNAFGSNVEITSTVAQDDINRLPASTASTENRWRWQPYYFSQTDGTYRSNISMSQPLQYFCPRPAQRLATFASESAFQTALLNAVGRRSNQTGYDATRDGQARGGYTNHDLGMVWGARYLSGGGMFAADNPDEFDATPDGVANPVRVSRHLIFLTDGDMTATNANYSSFGIPTERNRTGADNQTSASQLESQHVARFRAACSRARQMGMTIWVIILDSSTNADVANCATDDAHYFVSNGTDLGQVFQLIGRGIGRLRLTN